MSSQNEADYDPGPRLVSDVAPKRLAFQKGAGVMTRDNLPPDLAHAASSPEAYVAWLKKYSIDLDPETHLPRFLASTADMLQGRTLDEPDDEEEESKAAPGTGPVQQ